MSRVTLLSFDVNHACQEIKHFKNAWGFADYVWTELCKRYLGASDNDYIYNGLAEKVWTYYKDTNKPYFERILLAMTFDRAFIEKDSYGEAAKHIRQFLTKYPPNPSHSNHWNEIANFLGTNPDHESIGFESSLAGNMFIYVRDYDIDEELEFVKKKDCFNVFENTPRPSEEHT